MSALDGKALLEYGEVIARRYAARVGTDLAEELRAEAVLRALRSPAPDGRMEPWLERIYRNLLIDRWRHTKAVTVDVAELDRATTTTTPESTPEDRLLAHERRRLVRASLRRLPREARQILLSRYYGELDESATASRFGIAGATVRTRLHRALRRMRSWLGDLRAFCPPFLGRLADHLGAISAAPVLFAVLILVSVKAQAPETFVIATAPPSANTHALHALQSFVPMEIHPSAPATAVAPRRHTSKRTPAAQAAFVSTAESVPVVAEIRWPEPIDVFAEPEAQTLPCLVEAPATFALQIEKMVEEDL